MIVKLIVLMTCQSFLFCLFEVFSLFFYLGKRKQESFFKDKTLKLLISFYQTKQLTVPTTKTQLKIQWRLRPSWKTKL
uniref:Uncharacterized protein n=1 Tax=Salix viminalis TaxID=40686 RepID=A0A6N2MQV3_SALVM